MNGQTCLTTESEHMADVSMPERLQRLTPKQEAFALAYVTLGNASEAYRSAYNCKPDAKPAAIAVEASKLLANPNVALRVSELQERASAKVVLNRAWVLEKLMSNATKAAEAEDYIASNKALELLGKTEELQMFVERASVTSDNRHHHSAEPLSPFAQHLAEVLGVGAESSAERPLPN